MLARETAFAALLEQIADCAIAINHTRHVVLANREAHALLQNRKLIRESVSGCLGFAAHAAEAAFTKALEGCVGKVKRPFASSFMVRTGNRAAHPVHVVPLHTLSSPEAAGQSSALALILIGSDRGCALPSESALRNRYGLSRREAVVVLHVAAGATLKETADALGVMIATVRNQLAAAMRKLGVRRRAELVALLAGLISRINLKAFDQ